MRIPSGAAAVLTSILRRAAIFGTGIRAEVSGTDGVIVEPDQPTVFLFP
jgi:hypothetical protein